MKQRALESGIRGWIHGLGLVAFLLTVLAGGTGCGALSAAANPKVAWALNDPAPMSVVVRRADVAETTARQVDRFMTSTPANDDSAWLAKVAPQSDEAAATLTGLREHPLYAPGGVGAGSRIVAAEVWAKSLARLESTDVAKPQQPAAPEAKASAPKAAKKGKREKKAPAEPAPSRVEPAPPLSASSAKYPSLLAAIDKDLGASWTEVANAKRAIGERKTQIASAEAANDVKGVSDADKKANKATIDRLEKEVSKLEKEAGVLAEAFVVKAKAAASKATPEVREKVGAVVIALRQAVEDANIANGAAALRYPLAAATLLDSAKAMAAIYVADVIEEKTGKRPSTQGLQPGVTMEGGKVAITLNGLSQSDMGKLSVGEITTEVASRTTKWVGHALGLLGTISATKDMLTFENDVLAALVDGFKASGWAPPPVAAIPDGPAPTAAAQPRS
jgi:hypothetical protein